MGVISDKDEKPAKILGMPTHTFFLASGVVIFLAGYSLYELLKKK